MIYTRLTKLAMRLCFERHREQVDKCGIPYPFHPFHVAESMTDEKTTCVALLHDILEDTETTKEELLELGFPGDVVEAICLMTHEDGVPYLDYVRQIGTDPIARAVKISDLKHNSDLSRLDTVTEADLKRVEKYGKALELLTDRSGITDPTPGPETGV